MIVSPAKSFCLVSSVLLLGLVGCQKQTGPLSTPRAAFETWQSASKSGDWDTFFDCTTPEVQNRLAGLLLLEIAVDEPESSIARFGVTRKQVMQIDPSQPLAAACDQAGKLLNEKRVIVAETFAAKLDSGEWLADKWNAARISDIQIDGDVATASLSAEGDRMQIRFVRIDEEWRIDLPVNLFEAMGN